MRVMSRDHYRPKINPREKWLLFWFWIFIYAEVATGCPKVCQCKWRNGKQWVTCTNAKFIDIPRGLEPSTQVLNLQHNNLKILFTDAFYDRSLVNLQKVFLSHCKIRKLEKGSLRKLANLIELDLSSNLVTSVPSEALRDVPGLRELEMKENNLTYLPKDAFQTTPDLVLLDVSFNNITSVHNQAFRSLTRLEVLKISGNKISTMSVETLKPLVALHGFHVHFNPWVCDCILRPLRQYMIKRNIVTSVPPTCYYPERLKGRKWKTLELNEFVCVPEVTAVEPRVMAASGENVSLACAVGIDPEVEVTWKVGDRLLSTGTNSDEHKYKVLELIVPEQDEIKRVSNLTISWAVFQDQGTYKCVVENKAGRVETNMTLKVSEVISEEPLVAINEMFIAGVILGALVFVLISVIAISVILYKRSRQFDDDMSKLNNSKSGSLPLRHLTSDSEKASPSEQNSKTCKLYDYESIPTSETVDDSTASNGVDEPLKLNDSELGDNILNDLDKSDTEPCVKDITSNILHDEIPENISYIEIPKTQLNNIAMNQDQNPLLKNLAQQCRDEILRRKGLKKLRGGSLREKANLNQYPDLLDFPKDSNAAQSMPRRSSTSVDITTMENLDPTQHKRNPSLPSTPMHPNYEGIAEMNAGRRYVPLREEPVTRRQSLTLPLGEAFDLEFHASQLEHFLEEYKNLQEQLFRMKESDNNFYDKDDFEGIRENESILPEVPIPRITPFEGEVHSPSYLIQKPFYTEMIPTSRNSEPLKSILKSREPLTTTPSTTVLPNKQRSDRGIYFDT